MKLLIADPRVFFREVFDLLCKNGAHEKKFIALLRQYEAPIGKREPDVCACKLVLQDEGKHWGC